MPEQPRLPPIDIVTSFLQPRQLLLLLDNCEHLVAACAGLAESLLRGCPAVRILATSRQALGVEGETVWVVPPLGVPPATAQPDSIASAEAVRLFVERGRLQQPRFSLTPDNAGTIAQICRQLKGLPLALELAAGWLRLLPVADLAARLPSRQNLLANTNRSGPARHQTLQAAIDWSYGLLGESEQALFRRLGVFAGGFTIEAAEAICANADDVRGEEVLELLAQLLEKSLVEREERAGEVRLRLLEPLRQYASERLQASGEQEAVQARHAEWYLALAEEQELRFRGPQQKRAFERLEREHDNLRGALRWAGDRGEIGLRLVAALWHFWFSRSYFSEGRRWLDRVLAATSTLQVPARAIALNGAACLAWRSGSHDEVFARCAEALALSQALGNAWASAVALHYQAAATMERGELDGAARLHEQSLQLFREGKRTWWIALSLGHLAMVRRLQGDAERAGELAEESLALFRQTGDDIFTAHALDVVGFGWEQRGDKVRGAACYREALSLHAEQDDRSGIAVAFMRLASVAAAEGRAERAASLFGSSDAVLRLPANPFPQFYQAYADSPVAQVQGELDEHTFARAWAAGQSMPIADAIALALAEPPRPGENAEEAVSDMSGRAGEDGPAQGTALPEGLAGLSQRELEVLKLLALGRSNKQIGQALTLSVRTVERHIANVYLKIGAHGRADATSYAFRHGLARQA